MKSLIQRAWHALRKQNKGSSIVIVIVAIAFVGILGATILWMSLNNYLMKATDARHKASFYSAETVFEQIIAGLQEDASAAADASFSLVMQRYATINESERNHEFQVEFLNQVKKKLADGGDYSKFNMDVLKSYVDPELLAPASGRIRTLESADCKMDCPTHATYIILKDLSLNFEDENGFYTKITTDLVITAPENDFTQSASMPDIFDYCLVANKKLYNSVSGKATIDGSIYGGQDGIEVNNTLIIKNADKIVTDADITLMNTVSSLQVGKGDGDVDDIPALWAQNIVMDGGTIDLYSQTYIADDLTMRGSNLSAKLEQEYYGYGNSTEAAEKSSAMVVNGINNTIDMSGLDKLLIAGHSYIGTSTAAISDTTETLDGAFETAASANSDVMMGESIAIKGDQIAYLIPDECIGVLDDETAVGKNPLTGAEYAAMLLLKQENPDTFKEVSFSKTISSTGGSVSLSSYTTSDQDFKRIFCPCNGETMVYYYLVMNETNANRYFADYYGYHKDKLNRYFNIYAAGGIHANTFTRVNVQGNYMTSTADTGALGLPTQTVSMNNVISKGEMMNDVELAGESGRYTDTFSALKAKLITNYYKVSEEERTKSVFENLIKTDALDKFTADHGGTVKMVVPDTNITAIITNASEYNYEDTTGTTRLLLAKGDVHVKKNFTGLIMAGGEIDIAPDVTITSAVNGTGDEKEELKQVLQLKYSEGGGGGGPSGLTPDETKPIDLFVNGSSYVLDGSQIKTGEEEEDTTVVYDIDVTKLVRYENWLKQ